ncbi:MAG: hypothetical protein HY868_10260 [Chloroflexi bacterium]|nr:hypothetical protein [Chloroflexota bacterium]
MAILKDQDRQVLRKEFQALVQPLKMKIIYYKSLICPRCISTNRLLARVRREYPEIEIEEIEVVTHLPRAIRDGVMMLPTLIVGEKRYHHAPPMDELLDALGVTRRITERVAA